MTYITNPVESLIVWSAEVVKNRNVFPDGESALKGVYLVRRTVLKKRTIPIHYWKNALERL